MLQPLVFQVFQQNQQLISPIRQSGIFLRHFISGTLLHLTVLGHFYKFPCSSPVCISQTARLRQICMIAYAAEL